MVINKITNYKNKLYKFTYKLYICIYMIPHLLIFFYLFKHFIQSVRNSKYFICIKSFIPLNNPIR